MTTISQAEALDREALSGHEHTKFWRASRWHELECLRAEFVRHVYAPHTHDTYAFGVIEQGTEFFAIAAPNTTRLPAALSCSIRSNCMTAAPPRAAIAIE